MSEKYGNVSEYKEERKRIIKLTKAIRRKKNYKNTSWEQPAAIELRKSTLNGKDTLTLLITLTPVGCEWARRGGCTMCGEFESMDTQQDIISDPKFHISQFARGLTDPKVWEFVKSTGLEISRIRIYQEGNYTNDHETSLLTQETLIRLASMVQGVKKITIESRPQYLTEKTVSFLADLVKGKDIQLEIGMGLEAKDDVVRNVCINKNGSDSDFRKAVTLLKKYDILPLAYIILKPPFLTEMESIQEAVETVHYANEIGFSRISLEPMTIHGYTIVDALHSCGKYETPWLWSVIDVLKKCSDCLVRPGVGGCGYYPVPEEHSKNKCDSCNEEVINRIIEYNKRKDISVFDDLTCPDCYEKWKREVFQEEKLSLHERIEKQLDLLGEMLDSYTYEQPTDVRTDGRTLYKHVQ